MIKFSFVPFHHVYDEIAPNAARYYDEMNVEGDQSAPDINWPLYLAISKAGAAVVVTARDKGELIGYAAFTISSNPRHQQVIEATLASIFVEKPYRTKIGLKIVAEADKFLKQIGVHETNYVLDDELFGRVLRKKGYRAKYKVWSKKYGQ